MNENNSQAVNVAQIQIPKAGNTITLIEAIAILWKKRWILLFFTLIGAAIGLLYGMWVRPSFTSDALLQVNIKGTSSKATKAMGEMGAILDMASPADAEIELIKSRMVLSYVVDQERLCFNAIPVGNLDRLLHREGRMDIDSLNLPKIAKGEKWTAVAIGVDAYEVYTPEGHRLLLGKVGELYNAPYANDTLSIRVSLLLARSGQKFTLHQTTPLRAVRGLAAGLRVAEKGKQTGIIGVSYSHRYPDRAASILNSIANIYLRQNVEMRSAEAAKTLEFLEGQLPGVKAKLDSAEKILADYRYSIGSVDMNGETRAHLEKEMDLQRQLLQLEQERQKTTRLFKEEHPSVQTIIKQQNRVRGELNQLKKNAEKLPITQQEVMRLQEEVAVNNEVYTTMLNNIQQLRVVRAGEVGNVRIVDFGQIEQIQSKPKKTNILVCATAAGFMLGVLLIFFFRMLHNGVRSSLDVERETGLSVYAKIPKSRNRMLRNHNHLNHGTPFVVAEPDDPASESFNSLLTAIEFSLPENDNKVMMVTGLMPGVGKSFVSLNLASLMAQNGKKVLIIDGDMRRGVIRGKARFGLAEVLAGKATLDTVMFQYTVDNLYAICAGKSKSTACELLRTDAMKNLLEEAKQKFDFIVVDTPPLSLVTDAELICPLADFSLFVLHYGKHGMDEIKEAVEKIKHYTDKPCAFVMNHCEREPGHYYGYGYGYYGKYGYSKKK
ncbi:MAG: polysaccharide biosynthesis tyrosine autokinase [Fibrobacter sp.]|nr:polysaccharide biosynthesis tyrosine autokinase [Fibrobacter sp.]